MQKSQVGRFIAEQRKAQGLTQAELAEKLGISDRAVSKWETGNGTPGSAVMLRLCGILKVSVNELLSGEKIAQENYSARAEENLLKLKAEKENADKILLKTERIFGYAISAMFLLGTTLVPLTEIPEWAQAAIIFAMTAPFLVAVGFLLKIEQVAGFYECGKCHHKYVPTYKKVFFAPHYFRTRFMKCENCGRRSWHKKVLTK